MLSLLHRRRSPLRGAPPVTTPMVCPLRRTAPRRRLSVLVSVLALLALGSADAALAQAAATSDEAAGRALFNRAVALLDKKDYAAACPMLEEVTRLLPNALGAQMALGECYEGSGRLASAWTAYSRAEELTRSTKDAVRGKKARAHVRSLTPRLAHLTIDVSQAKDQPADISLERDGIQVGRAQRGVALPIDKGKHVIVATAPRRRRIEKTIDIAKDGDSVTVTIEWPNEPELPQPSSLPPPPPDTRPLPPDTRAPPPPPVSFSHHLQPGLSARVDVDPIHLGVRALPGLTLGLGDHFEIGASAILGRDMGVEPQVTAFILSGALKPLINIASPVFVTGGVHVGARAAAGLQWDPVRHFGAFLQIGGAYFFNVPDGYSKLVLLPSAEIQARL